MVSLEDTLHGYIRIHVGNTFDRKRCHIVFPFGICQATNFISKNIIALDCPKIQLQIATEAKRLLINNRHETLKNREPVKL